ncbi:uncharacterized protein F4812DRAFT_454132 [Daldinia caldariorum]|uniref:uncharacterized protein n=1 Tax=Daldinia caldariorum TaxID=326644 RepID=UPI002008900A|nr:uncharacterized protein F4812DRAFT_454132 [Daldinia caldariorum]KAI1472319.1 hypothetical protein F4812DRAFT_454132 [Daldinia caldariorum]
MASQPPTNPLTQHRRPPPRQISRGPGAARSAVPGSPAGGPVRGTPTPTLKRVIWTGAIAAVTIVGAIYGAGLKTRSEYQQEKRKVVEATPEERVRDLEARRAALVAQRRPFERKLADLRARMVKTQAQAQQDGGGSGAAEDGNARG